MKIYKRNEHSLLVKSFGIKNRLYLAVTTIIFFDLGNPGTLLPEQQLWGTIPDVLGQGGILDSGMPKPRGEVLITGTCYPPGGRACFNSEVSFRVGGLEKRLNIFADRFWKQTGALIHSISYVKPFTEMPIIWEKAFGGKGFDRNPIGKGIDSVRLQDGTEAVSLPNIEDPRQLVGAPSDKPNPAGFAPIDVMWPQRIKKQGTYGEQWQRERWPFFPDDMNFEFFNTAPEDQFISGFFKGDETIHILNMHPEIQAIASYMPSVRIRCFVTKKTNLESGHGDEQIFEEIKTRIDTIHLFPGILRGVVMFRGTTEILDDEYADIVRIFLATESLHDDRKPMEHYFEEQNKLVDRSVPVDTAPLNSAQKKLGDSLKRIKSLPKEIEAVRHKAMGRAPKMPAPSPADMASAAESLMGRQLSILDTLEGQAKEMNARWGQHVSPPLETFERMRGKLKETGKKINTGIVKLERARNQGEAAQKEIAEMVTSRIASGDLARVGLDPDNLMPSESVNPWHDRGFSFVVQSRKTLERDPEACRVLHRLGFNRRTIKKAWLGWNLETITDDPKDWGLDPQDGPVQVLPAGLVIPHFTEATLDRLCIRSAAYHRGTSDVIIKGSKPSSLFLPAASVIDVSGKTAVEDTPIIRVSDELQAWFVEQEVGDACSVVALKHPNEKTDGAVKDAVDHALCFLIILPRGIEAGKEWTLWEKAFPNALKLHLPTGETVFDTMAAGTDIRQWIMDALPEPFAETHRVEPALPEPDKPTEGSPLSGLSLPMMDIKAAVLSAMDEVKAFNQPAFQALKSEQKHAESQAKAIAAEFGKDAESVMADAKNKPRSFALLGKEVANTAQTQRERLISQGALTPEMDKKLADAGAAAERMGQDAETRFGKGLGRLNAEKQQLDEKKAKLLAGELPDKAKEAFRHSGIDPDRIKKRTREDIIAMYSRGESLAGAILSGIDLTDLDLHGIDLSGALCKKTRFCGANLSGADLSQMTAQEADFTNASLKGMHAEKGIFLKALFKSADLSRTDISSAVFRQADLTNADCTGSRFYMTSFQKSQLPGTIFTGLDADMCVFSDADASDAVFRDAKLNKCLFKGTVLDHADFSGAVLASTMFYGARGDSVRFSGADMSKSRMGGQSVFPGADFTGVKMTQGCFRDSDLSGARFQGGRLELSMVENCDLRASDFYRVPAHKTRFAKSNLEGADLRGLNLFLGSLRKARLVNADLRASNLFGVDFYKAVFGGTRLERANIKMTLIQGKTEYLE